MKMTDIVSELKVMKSAAGYYVGRGYYDEEIQGPIEDEADISQDDMCFPWSRESGYFGTHDEAQAYLDHSNTGLS